MAFRLVPREWLVPVAVGAVSAVAESSDIKNGRTKPLRRYKDYVALGATALGLAMEQFRFGSPDMARDVSTAGRTLLGQALVYALAKPLKIGALGGLAAQQVGGRVGGGVTVISSGVGYRSPTSGAPMYR